MNKIIDRAPWSILFNLLLVYICYMVCRVLFVAENWAIFAPTLNLPVVCTMLKGALRFDTSAIVYTNLLYMLLVLLPLHYKEQRVMRAITKWTYIIPNALAIIVNLMDTVYFPYSMRRTTSSIFKEFGGNTNLGSVIGIECVHHWYLVLAAAAMIAFLWFCYRDTSGLQRGETLKHYYWRQGILLVIAVPLAMMGMRGNSLFHINRPISTTEAIEYINEPVQAGIVMNTPFSLIRTSRKALDVPKFYASQAQAEAIFSPVHYPADSLVVRHKNLVIILLESLSEEFVGAMHRPESGEPYATYTPFIDSLYRQSLTFEQSFANGWMSTDGLPIVHASMPRIYNGYIVSPYAMNETPGLAKELAAEGYHAAYFHGAEDSSLGLKGSARSTGITDYYGMSEYIADSRFGGNADYDGTWGIWDEKFLHYFCVKLGELPQPFLATFFSLNNHHPFSMPKEYEAMFPDTEPDQPVKRTVRYTDYCLRLFFEQAKKQPWYDNTLFVITADHCYHNIIRPAYRTALGQSRVPIMFFDPSGQLPRGTQPGIAQQIDIMPTLLSYVGYDKPYVAYGKDLLNTPAEQTWAFMYHDIPQMVKGDYLVQLAGFRLSGVYRYKTDFRLQHNLLESGDYDQQMVEQMVEQIKALLQSIDTRMRENTLRQLPAGALNQK